jgi:hypothetical protein
LAFYHPDDLEASRDLFANLLREKGKEINRVREPQHLRRRLGALARVEHRVVPHEALMYCVAGDTTDRRRTDDLRAVDAAKTRDDQVHQHPLLPRLNAPSPASRDACD